MGDRAWQIVRAALACIAGALAAYARSVLLPVSRRRDAWLDTHGPCWTCFRRRTHRSSFGAYRAAYRLGHLGAGPYYGSVTTAGLKHRGDQASFRACYDPAVSQPQGSGVARANYTLPAGARAYATRWRVAASLLLHGQTPTLRSVAAAARSADLRSDR